MRKCFVLRPFSDTAIMVNGKQAKIPKLEWEHIYNVWIKPSVENFPDEKIECKCSELLPGNFLRGILSDIYSSDFVIADLTGQKPNVYYELGIRHALRMGTIIITQDLNALPSDLRAYSCIEYNYPRYKSTNQDKINLFASNLHKNLRSILKNNFASDSPVSDLLQLNYFFAQHFEMTEIKNFYAFILRLEALIKSYFDILKRIKPQKLECLTKNSFPTEIINIARLNSLYSGFNNLPSTDIMSRGFMDFETKIFSISDVFNSLYHYWDIYGKNINKTNTDKYFSMIDKLISDEEKYIEMFIKLKAKFRELYFKKFKIELQ